MRAILGLLCILVFSVSPVRAQGGATQPASSPQTLMEAQMLVAEKLDQQLEELQKMNKFLEVLVVQQGQSVLLSRTTPSSSRKDCEGGVCTD
ncbi:hypothetical protein [Pseudodesulfovibrio pelocollis]|uniref:hypothetical protein n=1 Tax=Pseudodesulfovibrio pelocollis TaxID=3051432 RepID=UPI00255AB35E|nr:hypothetical protein [Pseudodesulfovibrio sp. SB368]